ncbi:MAG: hypothetical protein IKE34_10700 [Paenibacillus sp.]|uniref:hypothetical protein n=1 Tax=Paenibacillus aquistagni TaxID=1852522 RepID=UPI000B509E65|nr:hypothetical protein [Paenibacillus aquistagni]MBR2569636.1 hypothetical protein [Paenibacillus sp.]NMM55071.1 hypothetical protein [Paenibacillus aquistagni]
MWERIIEYGFGFFVDIVRGVYPISIVLYLLLVGSFGAAVEIWRSGRRGAALAWSERLKEGAYAVAGLMFAVGVCAFIYKCLQRAVPFLELPGVDNPLHVAVFSIAAVAGGIIAIVVLELVSGISHALLASKWFWGIFGFSVIAFGAYLLKLCNALPASSNYTYVLGGVMMMVIVAVDIMLKNKEKEAETASVLNATSKHA